MVGFYCFIVHGHHHHRHHNQVCGQDLVGPYQIHHLLPSNINKVDEVILYLQLKFLIEYFIFLTIMDGVQENLRPTRSEKTLGALKAERAVKRITFERTEANPQETLYVSVPKLNENEVIVPGSLALRFNIDLSGGHANNFLVDNVGRALVDKLVVKYSGTILQDTVGYDIYKIFEDLFLS